MTTIRRLATTQAMSTLLLPRKCNISRYISLHRVLQDGFFTGGKDNKIFKVDLMGNPVQLFDGHEGAVNSLSQCLPEELVSGSWDG